MNIQQENYRRQLQAFELLLENEVKGYLPDALCEQIDDCMIALSDPPFDSKEKEPTIGPFPQPGPDVPKFIAVYHKGQVLRMAKKD